MTMFHLTRTRLLAAGIAGALLAPATLAHVNLLDPVGGETLDAGSTFTIHWEVHIQHNTQNWDLEYSTESSDGPWLTVAEDLPPGDTFAGAQHFFDWTVPATADDTVWVRVRQDNNGTDYYDVSESAFAIASACLADVDGTGDVAFGDILAIIQEWGPCPAGCAADVNGDLAVDFADILEVITAWGPC